MQIHSKTGGSQHPRSAGTKQKPRSNSKLSTLTSEGPHGLIYNPALERPLGVLPPNPTDTTPVVTEHLDISASTQLSGAAFFPPYHFYLIFFVFSRHGQLVSRAAAMFHHHACGVKRKVHPKTYSDDCPVKKIGTTQHPTASAPSQPQATYGRTLPKAPGNTNSQSSGRH